MEITNSKLEVNAYTVSFLWEQLETHWKVGLQSSPSAIKLQSFIFKLILSFYA